MERWLSGWKRLPAKELQEVTFVEGSNPSLSVSNQCHTVPWCPRRYYITEVWNGVKSPDFPYSATKNRQKGGNLGGNLKFWKIYNNPVILILLFVPQGVRILMLGGKMFWPNIRGKIFYKLIWKINNTIIVRILVQNNWLYSSKTRIHISPFYWSFKRFYKVLKALL